MESDPPQDEKIDRDKSKQRKSASKVPQPPLDLPHRKGRSRRHSPRIRTPNPPKLSPRKARRQKQNEVNRIVLNNMRKMRQRDSKPFLQELWAGTTQSGHRTLDLKACNMKIGDLVVLQEFLRNNPSITALDANGNCFTEYESELLLSIVSGTPRILHVSTDGAALAPEGIAERIQSAVESNRANEETRRHELADRRQQKREAKRDARAAMRRQKEIEDAKQRQKLENMCCSHRLTETDQQQHRHFIELQQRGQWALVLAANRSELALIQRRSELRDLFLQQLRDAELEESEARAGVARSEEAERIEMTRRQKASRQEIETALLEKKRAMRKAREAVKTAAFSEKREIRVEEDAQREALEDEINPQKDAILRAVAEQKRREEEDERRRREEEAARRKAEEEEARRREELLRARREQISSFVKTETDARDTVAAEERNARKKLKEDQVIDRNGVFKIENYNKRCADRDAVNSIPPTIHISPMAEELSIALGSTQPQSVVKTDNPARALKIDYEVVKPAYMLHQASPSSKNKSSVKFAATSLEPNEVTNGQWLAQKTTTTRVSIAAIFHHFAHTEMQLVLQPQGFQVEGDAEAAGAVFRNDAGTGFAVYNVDPTNGVHIIDFTDCITEAMILRVLQSIMLLQNVSQPALPGLASSGADAAQVPFIELSVQMAFPNLSGGECSSTFFEKIQLDLKPPLLFIGREDMTRSWASYVEGDGQASVWKELCVAKSFDAKGPLTSSFVTLTLHPYLDPADILAFSNRTGISFVDEEKHLLSFLGSPPFAEVATLGPLVAGKDKGGREVAASMTTVIKLGPSATTQALQALLRCVAFENDSEAPVDGRRTFSVGITLQSQFQSFCSFDIDLVGQDDPTVIDFGLMQVPYRFPSAIPSQHEEFAKVIPFHFAAASNVFDVDTTTFQGGFLAVRLLPANETVGKKAPDTYSAGTGLGMDPAPPYGIELAGKTVLFHGAQIATCELQPQLLHFDFGDSSIEAVQALFKTFTFKPQMSTAPITPVYRTVEVVFVCGEVAPVRAVCNIKVTDPLVSILMKDAFWTYKEGAGQMPLGNFTLSSEDEGWDGGFFFVEFVRGYCEAEDVLAIRESPSLKLVTVSKDQGESPESVLTTSSSIIKRSEAQEKKETHEALTSVAGKRDASDVRSLVRKRLTEKVRQIRNARQRAHDELRRRILEEVRSHRGVLETLRMEKWIVVDGNKVGLMAAGSGTLQIRFATKYVPDSKKTRLSLCGIKRKEALTVLRHICYANLSKDPKREKKILRITASDGTPHISLSTVEFEVQPVENATELRRLNNDPKPFRLRSPDDVRGFRPFSDVTLYDADTFAFNGATLAIDLVGGGDKGEQLGILTEQQAVWNAMPDASLTVPSIVVRKRQIFSGDRLLGTIDIDTAGKSNLIVRFTPLAKGVPLPGNELELEANPMAISIIDVESVLQSVTYTNVASKPRAGSRIYQARVIMMKVEGKLKVVVDVDAPLMENPALGRELRYKERSPPVNVLPKLVLNLVTKTALKRGTVSVGLVNGQEPADGLVIQFPKEYRGEYEMKRGSALFYGSDYIGNIEKDAALGHQISLTLDWASRANTAHLTAFFRSVAFIHNSNCPAARPREIEASIALNEKDTAVVRTQIDVVAEDDPTEIQNVDSELEVVRLGPPLFLMPNCRAYDPDTDCFTEPSYFQLQIIGATPADVFLIAGHDMKELEIQDHESGNPENPLITIAKIRGGSADSLVVALLNSTLLQLEGLLRRVQLQIGDNPRDKAATKLVKLTVKTGTAPPFHLTQGIKVYPPLFSMPPKVLSQGVRFASGDEPLGVFSSVAVESGNCSSGTTVVVTIEASMNGALGFSPTLSPLFGLSTISTADLQDPILLDGKEVGRINLSSRKGPAEIEFPAGNAAPAHFLLQKCLKSLVFRLTPPADPAVVIPSGIVQLFVTDVGKKVTLTQQVPVHAPIPPGTRDEGLTSDVSTALPDEYTETKLDDGDENTFSTG